MHLRQNILAAMVLAVWATNSFAAYNFQEPTGWTVGDAGSTSQQWDAAVASFQPSNSPPTSSNLNPAITTTAGTTVQTPGFVAGSGGYYSFNGPYNISANIYNHGGPSGAGGEYLTGFDTRVVVQTAATTNPDSGSSVFVNTIRLVKPDGTPLPGGSNGDLVSVTELFRQEIETPVGLADHHELRFEFLLSDYSADFRIQFQEAKHSSFQHLRVDTFLVGEAHLPGDFDGDGKVDGLDLAQWKVSYGTDALGDADGDGDSDGRDFLAWQRNYTQPPEIAAFSVPEPTSSLIVIFGIISFLPRRPSH